MNPLMNDDHSPDYATAHYAARASLSQRDLYHGTLIMANYLYEYQRQLGTPVITPAPGVYALLDNAPTIASDPIEKQLTAEAFQSCGLDIPTGLNDLPLTWARAIRETVLETFWPEYSTISVADVFGWATVLRFGPYLHLEYGRPIPRQGVHWDEIGEILVALHQCMEPGPFTPVGRLCEFA